MLEKALDSRGRGQGDGMRSRRSFKGVERSKAKRRRGVRGVAILAMPGKSHRICCVAPVPGHCCSPEAGLLAGSKASRMEVTFSASLPARSGHDRLLEEMCVDVVGVLVTGLQKADAPPPYVDFPLAGYAHAEPFWTRAVAQDGTVMPQKEPGHQHQACQVSPGPLVPKLSNERKISTFHL